MEELLEKIENVLIAEVDTHTSMVHSSKEFTTAIKEGDNEAIDRQRLSNDEMVCSIEHLEEKRKEYCREAAEQLGIRRTPLKLSMLIEKIPHNWKIRIEKQQNALKAIISELTRINTTNRILLEEGLKMIGATFSCIKKSGNRFAGYSNRGQTMDNSMISIINRTA